MFLDDLHPGFRFETAAREMTEAEIVGFAREWDWQDFHTDAEAAARSPYGGIIASGFHTLLVAFGLELGSGVWKEASMGSPGMDEIRWLRPVRPGDTLRVVVTVAEVTPSQSRPDRGRAVFDHAVLNQSGETVMTYRATVILARRPRPAAET